MGKEYCYKFKHNVIKVKENNAYAKPLIEKYGFKPMQDVYTNEAGEETYCWAEGWAKNIKVDSKSLVAKWVKKSIEDIYAKEKEKENSKWRDSILEEGYEFDEEGKLVENEKYLSGLEAQLCVMATGEMSGVLFINMGGAVEFYDSKTLISSASEDVMQLEKAGAIYKKRLRLN